MEICRSSQLLGNLASPDSAFRFFSFQALTTLDFSSVMQVFLLKSACMNSEVFPLVLKSMPLNYTTSVPVHSVLNSSHVVIGTTSIIKGNTYRFIVRRVTITERGFFLKRSSFCAVLFLKDFPACFGFVPIPKFSV